MCPLADYSQSSMLLICVYGGRGSSSALSCKMLVDLNGRERLRGDCAIGLPCLLRLFSLLVRLWFQPHGLGLLPITRLNPASNTNVTGRRPRTIIKARVGIKRKSPAGKSEAEVNALTQAFSWRTAGAPTWVPDRAHLCDS